VLGGLVLWHLAPPGPRRCSCVTRRDLGGGARAAGGRLAAAADSGVRRRIAAGWLLGVVVASRSAYFMGRFTVVRQIARPYIEFSASSAIAFVTLAVIWLGPGEAAKDLADLYTTVFHRHAQHHRRGSGGEPAAVARRVLARAGPIQMLQTVICRRPCRS